MESARDWAGFKPTTGRFTSNPRGTYTEEEIDNTPRLYRIINLEERGQGGRAYKVCDMDGRVYDLREDALLDAWKISGMNPGGELNAEFVWSLQGTDMKLCVVGSKMHERLLAEDAQYETDEASGLNKVTTTTLYEVGKAYSTPSGNDKFIYLGPHPTDKGRHMWIEYYVYSNGTFRCYETLTFSNKVARVPVRDVTASFSLKDLLDNPMDHYRSEINKYQAQLLTKPSYPSEHDHAKSCISSYKNHIAVWHDTRVRYGLPV